MPSRSLDHWTSQRSSDLDQLERAHGAVGGSRRGRRFATLQVNHAYAMLLSSQFQGFCRDLHSECVDHIVSAIAAFPAVSNLLRAELTRNRAIDRGNPNPGNLGTDFNRLIGTGFWPVVQRSDHRNAARQKLLEDLNGWRNAIAHQDFASVGNANLRLSKVRRWRAACEQMAFHFDEVMRHHVESIIGHSPW